MASEMLFALECHDYEEKYNLQYDNVNVEPQTVLSNVLTRNPAICQCIEETGLQRTIRELFINLQNASGDIPGLRPDVNNSSVRSTGVLKELCLALRLQGLNARMLLPVSLGVGSGCGRQSTGEGGQCAASGGRRCFFCSRQPYVVVCCPSWLDARYMDDTTQQWQRQQQGPVGPGLSEALPPVPRTGCGEVVLVDPCLRELFRVAPSTPEYTVIVEQLPQVWVGPRAALMELADAMCGAMAINFRSQGLDVPPWRRRDAVMSRWDPKNQREVAMEVEPLGLLGTGTGYRYFCRADHHHQHYGETATIMHDGRLSQCASSATMGGGPSSMAICSNQIKQATSASSRSFTLPSPTGTQAQAQLHNYCHPEVVPAGQPAQRKAVETDPIAPVVVHGFNLPGPARAV
ncbi:hypothetical protein Vretimale_7 [Volvox reticuliferus]|uniref:Uncharacterized protein n=1 Tax=Volvox reticuliferus TaxID=1737510 RepID=A0A8J4FJN3_9CHLO|nr:hypothetical protein Vretifemale_8389 [Volvox reticuliferus]GIL93687.1 hypothetical protein Vretimale_7 [Volvox reticuliferus]